MKKSVFTWEFESANYWRTINIHKETSKIRKKYKPNSEWARFSRNEISINYGNKYKSQIEHTEIRANICGLYKLKLSHFGHFLTHCKRNSYHKYSLSVSGAQIINNPWIWYSHNILRMKNDKSKYNSLWAKKKRSGCHDWQVPPW